jgi:serine/threonine protein kinase
MAGLSNQDDETNTHTVLTKGTMVSHYRIVDKIGAGGMGEVYVAQDTETGREVGLTFLPEVLTSEQAVADRFTRKAQAAAKLKHPNVAAVYEAGEFKGRPYFSSEFVQGKTIDELIEGPTLSVSRVIDLAIQMAEALQAAHAGGVVHGHLKSTSIYIDKADRVKIADFGLAVLEGCEEMSRQGQLITNVNCLSPEQVDANPPDERSDLFSLGVILYAMFTGTVPFPGENRLAIFRSILMDDPRPPSKHRHELPEELDSAVLGLLEKDPAERTQSAADALADLKALRVTERAHRDMPKGRAWWVKTLLLLAVLIVLSVAGYVIISQWMAGQ